MKKTARKERFYDIALSGLLFGLSPILLKIASLSGYISTYTLLAAMASGAGFFFLQRALHSGRISIVMPCITALNIFMVFILSMALFGQPIAYLQWFGALAIIFGTADLLRD